MRKGIGLSTLMAYFNGGFNFGQSPSLFCLGKINISTNVLVRHKDDLTVLRKQFILIMMVKGYGLSILRQRIRNFNWTIKQLNSCSFQYPDGCDSCPDKVECVRLFDLRCEQWGVGPHSFRGVFAELLKEQIMKYICPVAKDCKSTECGHRVPHIKEPCKNHNHRTSYCSPFPPYCPGCIEYDEHEGYQQSISDRCGVVPPDKLY